METMKQKILDAVFDFENMYAPLLVSVPERTAVSKSLQAILSLDEEWQRITSDESTDVDTLREHLEKAFYTLYERGRIKVNDEIGLSSNGALLLNALKAIYGTAHIIKTPTPVVVKPPTLEEEVLADYYGNLPAAEQKKRYLYRPGYAEAFQKLEKEGKLNGFSTHQGGN